MNQIYFILPPNRNAAANPTTCGHSSPYFVAGRFCISIIKKGFERIKYR